MCAAENPGSHHDFRGALLRNGFLNRCINLNPQYSKAKSEKSLAAQEKPTLQSISNRVNINQKKRRQEDFILSVAAFHFGR